MLRDKLTLEEEGQFSSSPVLRGCIGSSLQGVKIMNNGLRSLLVVGGVLFFLVVCCLGSVGIFGADIWFGDDESVSVKLQELIEDGNADTQDGNIETGAPSWVTSNDKKCIAQAVEEVSQHETVTEVIWPLDKSWIVLIEINGPNVGTQIDFRDLREMQINPGNQNSIGQANTRYGVVVLPDSWADFLNFVNDPGNNILPEGGEPFKTATMYFDADARKQEAPAVTVGNLGQEVSFKVVSDNGAGGSLNPPTNHNSWADQNQNMSGVPLATSCEVNWLSVSMTGNTSALTINFGGSQPNYDTSSADIP